MGVRLGRKELVATFRLFRVGSLSTSTSTLLSTCPDLALLLFLSFIFASSPRALSLGPFPLGLLYSFSCELEPGTAYLSLPS